MHALTKDDLNSSVWDSPEAIKSTRGNVESLGKGDHRIVWTQHIKCDTLFQFFH